jgi:glyoxylase-like metal-dependent hydrolase (beta-lactamase superfamily II)
MSMKGVQRIDDDLFFLQHPTRPGWFCGITVVVGSQSLGLVDTGFEETVRDYLLPFLNEIGRDPADISMVYNTHGDGDHVQGNAAVKELGDAKIACHEVEASSITHVDLSLKDGDTLALGDRTFTVVHCPGHRPGNSCLFDRVGSLLISGDTIVGTRSELIRMGAEPYIASLRKILGLAPATVVMSHPFAPAGKNVLAGDEVAEMIEASIKIAESGA